MSRKRLFALMLFAALALSLVTPAALAADEPFNLAQGQSVAASDVTDSDGPEGAVNGSATDNGWHSGDLKPDNAVPDDFAQTPQWLQIDLGATGSTLTAVKISYANNKVWPMSYELQTTDDPEDESSWRPFCVVTRPSQDVRLGDSGVNINGENQNINDNAACADTITAASSPALVSTTVGRYVRLYIHKTNAKAPGRNVNIREIEIIGTNPSRVQPIDLTDAFAAINEDSVALTDGRYVGQNVPEGALFTVRGSVLENVVANDGTVTGFNIGPRDVTLLVRLSQDRLSSNYKEKNLTVTVPDNKSAYPAEWFPAVTSPNPKPGVVPSIQEWYGYQGSFTLSESSRVVVDDAAGVQLQKAADIVKEDIQEITGLDLEVVTGESTGQDIVLHATARDEYAVGEEGYVLRIADDGVHIYAPTYTGCLFGAVSVEQMLWLAEDHVSIPKGICRDYPAYEVRGLALDIARTPYRCQLLKDYAKIMLWYKMSEYHLHINDNENASGANFDPDSLDSSAGFHRLDSATFPSLKSETKHSVPGGLGNINEEYYNENADYQGNPSFSKEEWRDLAQLSADLGQNLLTEIDMPGHSGLYNRYAYENPDGIDWLEGGVHLTSQGGRELLALGEEDDGQAQRALRFAKELWNEYTGGSEPTIYGDIVHIGADEYWESGHNDQFAKFADEMRKVIQKNLGEGTTIRMWGAGNDTFSTAPTALGMTPQELAREYQLDIWAIGHDCAPDRVRDGYQVVNCRDCFLYGNPGRTVREMPNAEYLYDHWDPTIFDYSADQNVLYGEPNLLGAKAVIWGDESQEGVIERDQHSRVLRSIQIVSEKTWGGQSAEESFSDFELRANTLDEGPGTAIAMTVDSKTSLVLDYDFQNISADGATVYDVSGNGYHAALTGGTAREGWLTFDGSTLLETPLKTLSYPYTVTFQVKAAQGNDAESSLFSGYDGRIQVAGRGGHLSADVNYFTRDLGYTVPTDGTSKTVTIVGTAQATRLYVDGELVTFLSQKGEYASTNYTGAPYSPSGGNTPLASVVLPLEKIGQDFHGGLANLKVFNKALSAAQVADLYAGTENGLVNVAQNAVAGSRSDKVDGRNANGKGQDTSHQRVATAEKAIDGEEEEIYSYWIGNDGDSALTVDLGQARAISQVDLLWRAGGIGSSFRIETSTDGTAWTTAKAVAGNTQASQSIPLDAPVTARYVRMQGAQEAGFYLLEEFKVYEKVDKTALLAALTPAAEFAAQYSLDFTFTGKGKTIVDALAAGQAVADSPLATQSEVDEAAAMLSALDLTFTPDLVRITQPADLACSNVTSSSVVLSWTPSVSNMGEIREYQIFLGDAEAPVKSVSKAPTMLLKLSPRTPYTVRLVAVDDKGYSSPAASVTFTTAAPSDSGSSSGSSGRPNVGGGTAQTGADGSVTTTVTDKATGAVTTTTKQPDGQTVVKVSTPGEGVSITLTAPDGGEVLAKVTLPETISVEKTFEDVPTAHWAKASVDKIAALGLVKGTSETTFSGTVEMDRGMMATILHRLSGEIETGKSAFADVKETDYYAKAVDWASSVGVLKGVSAETYAPGRAVSRQELALMLYRYAGFLGLDTKVSQDELLDPFADRAEVASWTGDAMAWAVDKGLLKGRGESRLAPAATATRAEVAVILDRFLDMLK